MRPLAATAAVAFSLAALGACAPTGGARDAMAARTPRQCLDTTLASDFRRGEGRTLYVTDRRGPTYQLESFGRCPGLENALAIGLSSNSGPDYDLCQGDWGRLALHDGDTRVCQVRVVRVLTPEEAARLPG